MVHFYTLYNQSRCIPQTHPGDTPLTWSQGGSARKVSSWESNLWYSFTFCAIWKHLEIQKNDWVCSLGEVKCTTAVKGTVLEGSPLLSTWDVISSTNHNTPLLVLKRQAHWKLFWVTCLTESTDNKFVVFYHHSIFRRAGAAHKTETTHAASVCRVKWAQICLLLMNFTPDRVTVSGERLSRTMKCAINLFWKKEWDRQKHLFLEIFSDNPLKNFLVIVLWSLRAWKQPSEKKT